MSVSVPSDTGPIPRNHAVGGTSPGPAWGRFATYNRVSTKRQAETGTSLDEMRRRTRAYGEDRGGEFVGDYCDAGLSGSDNARPEYLRLLGDAQSGRFDTIVVWKLDRFGRDTIERLTAEQALVKAGVDIVSVTEGVSDPDDPSSLLIRTVLAGISEYEKGCIKQRVKMNARSRVAEKGKVYTSRYPPLGYRFGEKGSSTLVVDPLMAPLARRIFSEFAQGRPISHIARDLVAEGIRSPTGKDHWYISTLVKILSSEKYIGMTRIPHEEALVETHVAIVERETWDRVQSIRESKKSLPSKGRAANRIRSPCFEACLSAGSAALRFISRADGTVELPNTSAGTVSPTGRASYPFSTSRPQTRRCSTTSWTARSTMTEPAKDCSKAHRRNASRRTQCDNSH